MTEITVQFSDIEIAVIEELCASLNLSHQEFFRHALALYQYVYIKKSAGGKLAFLDSAGNVIKDAGYLDVLQ